MVKTSMLASSTIESSEKLLNYYAGELQNINNESYHLLNSLYNLCNRVNDMNNMSDTGITNPFLGEICSDSDTKKNTSNPCLTHLFSDIIIMGKNNQTKINFILKYLEQFI